MDTTQLAKSLNDLLEFLNDSHLGYQQSADAVTPKKMNDLFNTLSGKRKNMASELAGKIQSIGAAPKEGGSMTGAAHRLFVNLKGLLTGGEVDSIVNEIKRGENMLLTRYKEVLREQLPEDVHSLLYTHLVEVEKDLESIDKLSVMTEA